MDICQTKLLLPKKKYENQFSLLEKNIYSVVDVSSLVVLANYNISDDIMTELSRDGVYKAELWLMSLTLGESTASA